MTRTHSGLARLGQGLTGAALLIFATGASVVSLTINYRYGMQTGATAAAIFLLADGAKFGLLTAIGAGQWSTSTKATLWAVWLACFATSLFAASNAYIDENAAELFERGHKAVAYAEAQTDLADARSELNGIRQQLAGLTVPDAVGLTDLAAQAKARLAKAEGDAAKADGDVRKARTARNSGREEAASRAKATASSEATLARADLARITGQLADAKRRDELEKRRGALEARLSDARGEVKTTAANAKGQALGVVRLVSHFTGRDAGEVGQDIGLIKAGLFITLMEALILLAAPGVALLLAAIWPAGGSQPVPVKETPAHPAAACPATRARQTARRKAPKPRSASKPAMTGTEIVALRGALGESQEAFAKRFSVDPRTVRRWENGERQMNRKAALAARNLAAGIKRKPVLHAVA